MARRRFQTGSVRLRTDLGPAYWQGRYWEDISDQAGKLLRKRTVIKLGLLEETPTEKAARQKLAAILHHINDVKHKARKQMTFGGFTLKYRFESASNTDISQPIRPPG